MMKSFAHIFESIQIKAWKAGLNYNEAKIRAFDLPDLFLGTNGRKIFDSSNWLEIRRSELKRFFEEFIYGISPDEFGRIEFTKTRSEANVFQCLAELKEIEISFRDLPRGPTIHVLLFVPKSVHKPVPAILGLNFFGNHTIHPNSNISIHNQWSATSRYFLLEEILPSIRTRGMDHGRWPIEALLERGYAVATAFYGDLEPDFPDGWRYGIRALLPSLSEKNQAWNSRIFPSMKKRFSGYGGPPWARPNDWGAVAVWGWTTSRIMDYLLTDPDIRSSQVVLFGHSRLGKAALWAGAQDERFAIVIANDSGCGGAALFRRNFGETIKLLNRVRPHWFCRNLRNLEDNELTLPVDQHMLIGLIAPRPVYIASASDDLAADPRGEFLSAREAGKVYKLFGLNGLGVETMPDLNTPVGDAIGYHIRSGRHGVMDYDWEQFIRFADRHFGKADISSSRLEKEPSKSI